MIIILFLFLYENCAIIRVRYNLPKIYLKIGERKMEKEKAIRNINDGFSEFISKLMGKSFEPSEVEKDLEEFLDDLESISLDMQEEGINLDLEKKIMYNNINKLLNALKDIRTKQVQSLSFYYGKDITKEI